MAKARNNWKILRADVAFVVVCRHSPDSHASVNVVLLDRVESDIDSLPASDMLGCVVKCSAACESVYR